MNMDDYLKDLQPFEVCSIRPPTENYSLTFKLARNCYWNKCAFCPVYKFGSRFSKRSREEVLADMDRAKKIDDALFDAGIIGMFSGGSGYDRLQELVDRVRRVQGIRDAGEEDDGVRENLDPRLAWFLPWFRERPGLEDSLQHVYSWRMGGGRTCFLGDADSLIWEPEFLAAAIQGVKKRFSTIERFSVYGRTRSAARLRSDRDLREYRKAGLDRVHFGLESGSDAVLKLMSKGETRAEHIEGMIKTREAGLSCSVYVMPGLGGRDLSEEHARDTAEVITRAKPDFVRLRSLQIFPGTPLEKMTAQGGFREADEEAVAREIRVMVEEIGTETEIMSDSASNLLDVNGRLPRDRGAMLAVIDAYLGLPSRDKLLFSLRSRVDSFIGQYGGLSRDIHQALIPFIKGNTLDASDATEDELRGIIDLIRSRLMP